MAHQTGSQNSKNSTTVQDILDQDIEYYESINKNLSPQLLVELGRVLLQERAELRQDNSKILDKLCNLEAELNEEKSHGQQLDEHVKTIKEEYDNLLNLMNFKQQQSDKRYNQLSEESSLLLEEVTDQLKRQRQTNIELKNLLKEIKNKQNQIRKLTITLTKVNEQNESLKKIKNINILLSEQFSQSELKLAQLREAEQKLRNQNQVLRDKVDELEEKVVQTEFALNQINKAKQIISEELEKRVVKQSNVKYKQSSELLKQIENNYGAEILGQYSDKESPERHLPANQKNQADFQNSLDNISENWDKISLKQIEASSKGKHFGYNIFNLDSAEEVNAFESTKKKQQTPIQKLNQKDQQSQFIHIPLSLDRKEKMNSEAKNQYQTVGKVKQHETKVGVDTPLQSHQSVQNVFSPEADMVKKHLKANSQFKDQQNKDRELQQLNKKLQQYKKKNSELQLQIVRLQSRVKQCVKEFNQDTQKQAERIQRLASELQQQKISNIDERKKKDEEYMRNLLILTQRCEDYEAEIMQSKKTIEHEKKAFEELYIRLLQVEEEKYQLRMNQSYENIHKVDQCIQTLSLLTCLSTQRAYNELVQSPVIKRSIETMTSYAPHISSFIQTDKILMHNKEVNTTQSYNYRSADRSNQSVSTQTKLCFDYSVQIKPDQLIEFKNKEVQNCPLVRNTGVGQYLVDHFSHIGIQAAEKKKILSITKLQQKTVRKQQSIKQQRSTQTQLRNSGVEENQNNEVEKKPKQRQNQKQIGKLKGRQKQNWPIRKFNPTSMAEEAAEEQRQKKDYPSMMEHEKRKGVESQKEIQAQKAIQLMKLNVILVNKTKRLRNNHLPSLNNMKSDMKFQLDDIINKYKDPSMKSRQYFLLYTLITRDNQIASDRLLLWREGLVSLYFGGTYTMTGTKKYIYDPVNAVLGNCEVILDKHRQTVELRKTTKNYFEGDLDQCIWRVLTVEAYGSY